MRTIYKYELEITDFQQIKVPVRSSVRSVQEILGKLYVYIEIDLSEREFFTMLDFRIVGTGNPIEFLTSIDPLSTDRPYNFLSTVKNGPFIWHVYWR